MNYCHHCGEKLISVSNYCPSCGEKLTQEEDSASESKSKSTKNLSPKSSSFKFTIRENNISKRTSHIVFFFLIYLITVFFYSFLFPILNFQIIDDIYFSFILWNFGLAITFFLIHFILYSEEFTFTLLLSSIKWLFFGKIIFDLTFYYILDADSYFYSISIFLSTYFAINAFYDFTNEIKYRLFFGLGWGLSYLLSDLLFSDSILLLLSRIFLTSIVSILFWKHFGSKLHPLSIKYIHRLFSNIKILTFTKTRYETNPQDFHTSKIKPASITPGMKAFNKKRVLLKYSMMFVAIILFTGSLFIVKVECKNCYGDGSLGTKYTCAQCKGSGRIRCTNTDSYVGTGWLNKGVRESYTCRGGRMRVDDGYDQFDHDGEVCSTCNGTGFEECWKCDGYGYTEGSEYCNYCDGSGEISLFDKIFN